MKMAKEKKEKTQPRHIILDEAIGWHENGALIKFDEGQTVTNPHDIARLIERNAIYLVVSHE